MQTYINIFERVTSIGANFQAWMEFKKDKRQKLDVQIFELNLEDNLFALHENLKNKKYKHGSYQPFFIRDPKVRLIHKAAVRDRVVHHLIFRALEPIFEPAFIYDSFSCRRGKGTHKGVKRLAKMARSVQQKHSSSFILKCDIKRFFASIDHNILIGIIRRRVGDENLMWLVEEVIGSFSSAQYERESKCGFATTTKNGCPIGNLTSQLFANIYMNELDQFVKHNLRVKNYVRYTDDFVIVHHDRSYLLEIKGKISNFLDSKLELSLHPNKISIRKLSQGIDFLGYVILPHAIAIRTKTKRRITRKIRLRIKQYKQGDLSEESLLCSLNSYLGIFKHANAYKLERSLRQRVWEWTKEKSPNIKRDDRNL